MVVFTGASVEEAIEKGLASLGLGRSQASITVLAKEKKGFLGLFGKQPAQVEVSALGTQEPALAEVSPVAPLEETKPSLASEEGTQVATEPVVEPEVAPEVEVSPVLSEASEGQPAQDEFDAFVAQEFGEKPASEENPYDMDQARQDVLAYVEKIIYEMDVEATITASGSRRQMILQIETPEPGRIIGYHGKVLKSLQLLAQNFLHDRYSRHFNVVLNVHDYLEHRMETLIEMANKAGRRVLESGRPYHLEPMTNHERKVIHKTISRLSGLESYSEGDDPHRYVVIVPRGDY